MASAGWHTALYSGARPAWPPLMALPVALLAVRHEGRGGRLLERSTYLVLAMPGLVIALALSYFAEHYLDGFGYQSAPLLVVAYAILFFPLALVGVRASVAYAPAGPGGDGALARAAAPGRARRVTLPLVGPGLAASFCLVFLAAVTELTATLVLVPTGRPDPRHPVLGLPAEPLLRAGGAVRPRDHRHRRRPELRARPILRPAPGPRHQGGMTTGTCRTGLGPAA